jgi:hypothetical protein
MINEINGTTQTYSQPSVKGAGDSNKPVEAFTTVANKVPVVVMAEGQPSPIPSLLPQPSPPGSSGSSFLDPLSIAAFVAVVVAVTRR